MKKFLVPFLAIVLAIGFSAFTTNKPADNSNGLNPTYFYYVVNANGEIESPSSLINPGDPRTHSEQAGETTCGEVGIDCLRGFETQLSTDPADYPMTIQGEDEFKIPN